MIATFFPLKKLRRNGKCLLFGTILLVGAVAVYHEMVAAKAWSGDTGMMPSADDSNWRRAMFDGRARRDQQHHSVEDSTIWRSSYTPQTWKPEYKGRANLHVFEDWCGSSTADLRKNMHYPLYPHSRITVQKLAVSPQWTNYGLRIFGYLHPFADGDLVFALSSDDNSEFWLSTDESPLNLQLLAWVGKTGKEWTAPGEFEKYASQTSKPVRLSSQRRYFFEVIHKQNDKGTDHVEVAWQLLDQGFRFMVIESKHISLYVNESGLLMNDVAHIPQTVASHQRPPVRQNPATADMLREDPRDTLYHVPFINNKFLKGVLPDCSYKPSYIIKDFPLLRYQGLQFVHMSYIYPNDYTRLTHMETESSCYYFDNPHYMKLFGFSKYMRLDRSDTQEKARDFHFQRRKRVIDEDDDFYTNARQREKEVQPDQQMNNALFPDYGDDFDDYVQRRRRKIFSLAIEETNSTLKNISDTSLHIDNVQKRQVTDKGPLQQVLVPTSEKPEQNQTEFRGPAKNIKRIKPKERFKQGKTQKLKSAEKALRDGQNSTLIKVKRKRYGVKERAAVPSEQLGSNQLQMQKSRKMNLTQIQRPKDSQLQPSEREDPKPEKSTVGKQQRLVGREMEPVAAKSLTTSRRDANIPLGRLNQKEINRRKSLREKEIEKNMPLQLAGENNTGRDKIIAKGNNAKKWQQEFKDQNEEQDDGHNRDGRRGDDERDAFWGADGDLEGDEEEATPAPVFDTEVNWSQTFQVNHMDLQLQRSDWIDLRCNISGNLLLHPSDAQPMVKAFMDKLNQKHHGRFTLVRVVNVVKRVDGIQGSRYLLELQLKDVDGKLLRLSHYIYALIRHSRQRSKGFGFQRQQPQLVLCNPVGFRWNPVATVHFIVPVKNQARWVQQLITDMELLFRETGDSNFNLIITDYNSTDMDVRRALQKSSLPRYQYVKLSGNFERSAGLQAGVDLITDDHSIVFLCDLHIHFPLSIVDTIRKHCVEGYMAFAPIVMRLDCGATPLDAKGFWEVNGFGLLGIYKSDLEAVGGMNTKEFKDRWGGEDWELLDRIFQAGLEVERIYLRSFFHHFHSKRGMWNRRLSSDHR